MALRVDQDELVVEECQRLRRRDRLGPLRSQLRRIRAIETLDERIRQRAKDEAIDAAAMALRAVPVELAVIDYRRDMDAGLHVELPIRRAAHGAVEPAADGEDRVADLFGVEAGAVLPPEELVVLVGRHALGSREGRLLVGLRSSRSAGGASSATRVREAPRQGSRAVPGASASGPSCRSRWAWRPSPLPKCHCQTRLTITRHVSGLSGDGQPLRERCAASAFGVPCRQIELATVLGQTGERTRFRLFRPACGCRRA